MGLGVLEDSSLDHVPGTVLLNDHAAHTEDITGALKHGTGRNANIVLSPQPSEDPNDPLNWPRWKKELIIWILCLGAMLHAGVNGPMLNASYFGLSLQLEKPLTTVVEASGYNLLVAGLSGPFVCAFSRKYGKRHVFLLSSLFDIIGTAIAASSVSYKYLLAGRIVQGFSTSAYESLIISAVGDMYFIHQRGLRIAIINFILNAASSLASIILGLVYQNLGYRWLFNLFQIFCVLQFVLLFLFCPESTYIRDERYNTDTVLDEKYMEVVALEDKTRHVEATSTTSAANSEVRAVAVPKKKTFVQELAIFTGVFSNDNILKFLFGPFIALLNPAGCYAILASGILNSWYVGSAIILAGIFAAPPYGFNAAQIGYLGAGPFIGGMLGSILVAAGSDPVIKWMTKRNNGTYEPEFRLVFMAIAGPACGIGMFLFGYTMSVGSAAELCAFFQGIMMFGVLIGIFATLSYGLDAFRTQSTEIFVMNMLMKNLLFYGLSNFANPWVAAKGPTEIMYVFGGTSLFLGLMAIPVYIFGKKLRSWWSRHDLFVKFNMTTTSQVEMG